MNKYKDMSIEDRVSLLNVRIEALQAERTKLIAERSILARWVEAHGATADEVIAETMEEI